MVAENFVPGLETLSSLGQTNTIFIVFWCFKTEKKGCSRGVIVFFCFGEIFLYALGPVGCRFCVVLSAPNRDLIAIAICDSNRESQITSDLKHCEPSQKSSFF